MIGNNPYNRSQRSTHKSYNINTQQDSSIFRKTDPTQFSQKLSSPSQYINRGHHPPIPNSNSNLKKSTINADQSIPSYRPNLHQNPSHNIKNFLPSPKNTSSTSVINLKHSPNQNGSRDIINSPCERKQSVNTTQIRESFGIKIIDSKQINQKIEILTETLKKMDKRLLYLERSQENNPKKGQFLREQENMKILNETVSKILLKYHHQWQENIKIFSQQISVVKQSIKTSINSQSIDRIVHDKIKQFSQITKCSQSIINSYMIPQQSITHIKKQTQILRTELEEKMRKNYDFLTTVIGRIQRQLHNNISNIGQVYKPSALKCSSSAILLRFVESFRVRKNGFKSGQSKIIITDNTYYIDNEGYLLDKDQHYLVDTKGIKVRLQQKHIKMLRDEQVLQ